MRRFLLAIIAIIALGAFFSDVQAQPNVSVNATRIRAELKNSATVVFLPTSNATTQPVNAQLSLSWLNTNDEELSSGTQSVIIPAGHSEIEIPFPLKNPSIWTRLRYSLSPEKSVARALAAAVKHKLKVKSSTLGGAYHLITALTDSTDEPYMLANFILATLASGDEALLKNAATRLASLAREERGGVYWDLQTNTPFYGWGTAGRYETTGLIISALSAWRIKHPEAQELDALIRRGLVFLLRGRNQNGYWGSTQSTLQAMHAMADASAVLGSFGSQSGSLEIRANGNLVKTINIPADSKTVDPISIEMSSFLSSGDNTISLNPSAGMQASMILFSSTHWLPWEQTQIRTSPELHLNVQFDKPETRIGDLVHCSVKAERVGFRGYGMMIAEIGLPPGAEVDRSSLEKFLGGNAINQYEVLPDRVLFYLWPKAGGVSFQFDLSVRFPMNAKSEPSILYDYYNPEALSEVAPVRWIVQ